MGDSDIITGEGYNNNIYTKGVVITQYSYNDTPPILSPSLFVVAYDHQLQPDET